MLENLDKILNSISYEWGNPSQAYLFVGENCDDLKEISTAFCEKIQGGKTPDIMKYDLSVLKVGDISAIIDESIKKPFVSNYKIFLIFNADKILEQAQNKLLKTLEEPNKYVIFVLTTTNPSKLLQTILSRVKRIDFTLQKNYSLDNTKLIDDMMKNLKTTSDIPRVVKENTLTNDEFFESIQNYFILASNKQIELSGYTDKAVARILQRIEEFYIKFKANVNFNYCLDLLLYKILEEKYLCK